jgi:hypothetical protein
MRKAFACPFLISACFIFPDVPVFAQKVIPDQSVLTASLSGANVTEKAVQDITAYNYIRSGSVKYVAGHSIHLKPGFHVASGANFYAKIEPVEQGSDRLSAEEASEENEVGFGLTAYPNPFSDDTMIEYSLPESGLVSVIVFDDKGSEVARIVEKQVQAKGKHKVTFASKHLAAGVYICAVNTPSGRKVQKIVKQ